MKYLYLIALLAILSGGCRSTVTSITRHPPGSFGDDVTFLTRHASVLILSDTAGNAQLALVPAWHAGVMTSTAQGSSGRSFGSINRESIDSSIKAGLCCIPGGEDSLLIGPVDGATAAHSASFETVQQAHDIALFRSTFVLTNKAGTVFQIQADRTVRLLSATDGWKELGMDPIPGINAVMFETINRLTNTGKEPWIGTENIPFIRVTGMFNSTSSYDAAGKVLTLVQYTLPENAAEQAIPKRALAVASSMIESTAPAAPLKPGETVRHMHRTFHLIGAEPDLDIVTRHALGK